MSRWQTARAGLAVLAAVAAAAPATAQAGFGAAPGSPFATAGAGAGSSAVGDLNGDGRVDVAVTLGTADDGVAVLLGDGAGRVAQAPGSPFGSALAGDNPTGLSAGDLDGNGTLDLALTAGVLTPNFLRALLTAPSGALAMAPGSPIATANDEVSTAVGDVTGDGRADLVAARVTGSAMSLDVHPGQGDGSFGPRTTHDAAFGALRRPRLGDMDGDGDLDVVVGTNGVGAFVLVRNTGGGTFAPGVVTVVPGATGTPEDPALADMNGDGRLDVVVGDAERVWAMLNDGSGTFAPAPAGPRTIPAFAGDTVYRLAAADVTADGRADVAATAFATAGVAVLAGDGAGGLAAPAMSATPGGGEVGIADFDGDAQPDLVTLERDGTTGAVLRNTDAAAVGMDPPGVGFGARRVADPGPSRAVTVRNTGTGRLRIGTVTVGGAGDFGLTGDGCSGRTLLVGQACAVAVAFRPLGAGERRGALNVPSNAPGSPAVASLMGTGAVPASGARPAGARIVSASLSRTTFAVASRRTATAAQRRRAVRRGTVLRVRTANATSLRVAVERRTRGRRVGGRCVRATRSNRRRRACTRWVRRMTLTRRLTGSQARIAFTGRTRTAVLSRGRHRLTLRAAGPGGASPVRRLAFRIVRAR